MNCLRGGYLFGHCYDRPALASCLLGLEICFRDTAEDHAARVLGGYSGAWPSDHGPAVQEDQTTDDLSKKGAEQSVASHTLLLADRQSLVRSDLKICVWASLCCLTSFVQFSEASCSSAALNQCKHLLSTQRIR